MWWVCFNFDEGKFDMDYFQAVFNNPRVVPIWYPVDEVSRRRYHITAQIVNWLYPKIQTPYIYFLADDDLIDKDGLEPLIDRLEEEYRKQGVYRDYWCGAVYGRCEVQNEQPDGSFLTACWCFEGQDVGLGTGIDPDCRLDSSQILHTKALWDQATRDGWQLSDKLEDAGHADGLLLNRLAQFATFHYVPQRINIHRRTRLSSWHKPQ